LITAWEETVGMITVGFLLILLMKTAFGFTINLLPSLVLVVKTKLVAGLLCGLSSALKQQYSLFQYQNQSSLFLSQNQSSLFLAQLSLSQNHRFQQFSLYLRGKQMIMEMKLAGID
jgi:hypothetical protein